MKCRISKIWPALILLLLIMGCKKDGPKIRNNDIAIKAKFSASKTTLVQGEIISFSDSTTGFPLTWSWTFEGGSPSTSNQQHPKNIKYDQLGEYNVTLVVTNAYGKDSLVRKGYIKVTREMQVPELSTIPAYDITFDKAKGGGEVLSSGIDDITELGICWNSTGRPSINDFKKTFPYPSETNFILELDGMNEKTTYYYRTYAINGDGVGYGNVQSFKTLEYDSCDFVDDHFTDGRDGQQYKYTIIGGNTWMAENLNYSSSKSWCYANKEDNCDKYGRLYSIEVANNVCPSGWRLPTSDDWNALIDNVGESSAVQMMKKNSWNGVNALNSFCFNALPSGYRNINSGISSTENFFGYWWSSSKNPDQTNIVYHISYDNIHTRAISFEDEYAFSIRCIKN